jgi:hypothetical protein
MVQPRRIVLTMLVVLIVDFSQLVKNETEVHLPDSFGGFVDDDE